MKDKREPMLVLKGEDINIVMDALETQEALESDTHSGYGLGATKLLKRIKSVMRLD